jgi:hypothetical protein
MNEWIEEKQKEYSINSQRDFDATDQNSNTAPTWQQTTPDVFHKQNQLHG